MKAYLKQQMGYGKAEALLYFKHPYRFNLLGQSRWLGRIYGELTTAVLSRRPVIYFGAFGRGLFQSLYEAPSSLLSYLPFTLEWNAIGILLFVAGLVSPRVLPIAVDPARDLDRVVDRHRVRARASTRASTGSGRARSIALLTYLGPAACAACSATSGACAASPSSSRSPSDRIAAAAARSTGSRASFVLRYWSEQGHEKEALLGGVMEFLIPRKYLIAVDPGWNQLGPRDLPRHLVEGAGRGRGREPRRHEAPAERALGDPADARVAAQPRVASRSWSRSGVIFDDSRGHRRRARRSALVNLGVIVVRERAPGPHPERHVRHRRRAGSGCAA